MRLRSFEKKNIYNQRNSTKLSKYQTKSLLKYSKTLQIFKQQNRMREQLRVFQKDGIIGGRICALLKTMYI